MFEKNLEKERTSWKALWTIYKWGNDSTGEIAQLLQNSDTEIIETNFPHRHFR